MSEIFTSLRLLEAEQHASPNGAKPASAPLAASTVQATDFEGLHEFVSPRVQEQPEPQHITSPLTHNSSGEREQPRTQASAGAASAMTAELPPFESVANESDLSALEERLLRAVDMMKQERQSRLVAEQRVSKLESEKNEQTPRIASLERELQRLESERSEQMPRIEALERELRVLRNERNSGRQRVERMLVLLDSLSF